MLQADPRSLQFGYGAAGKPVLVGPHAALRFNLSHSGRGLLIGFCSGRDVGVDLEAIVPARVSLDVARRLFSPRLVTRLEAAEGAVQAHLFFRAWTRLEARIKATGGGLGAPIPAGHRVRSYCPAAGFVAAVAIA
jgi:4'-phosphopantetheinyl transferase